MVLRTLDLFCGAGGSSYGASLAGAEIVCAVDLWDRALEAFSCNFPDAHVLKRKLTSRSRPDIFGDISNIDLILASPECTNHTCARGNRPRDADSLNTANHALKFARHFKPRWIVLENVVHMKQWDGYDRLLKQLKKDYYVRVETLDASHFGVPQSRRRLFILCDREKPPNSIQGHTVCSPPHASGIIDPKGIWHADLLRNGRRAEATLARAKRGIRKLGKGRDFLIVYYGSDAAGGWQALDRPLRTLTTLDRFGLVQWDEKERPTLRMLQVPELRRAMGFDDDFQLNVGTRREKVKMLGNSVSPAVMSAIIKQLTSSDAALSGAHENILLAAE